MSDGRVIRTNRKFRTDGQSKRDVRARAARGAISPLSLAHARVHLGRSRGPRREAERSLLNDLPRGPEDGSQGCPADERAGADAGHPGEQAHAAASISKSSLSGCVCIWPGSLTDNERDQSRDAHAGKAQMGLALLGRQRSRLCCDGPRPGILPAHQHGCLRSRPGCSVAHGVDVSRFSFAERYRGFRHRTI